MIGFRLACLVGLCLLRFVWLSLLFAGVSALLIVVIVNSVGYFISLCVCCAMLIAWFWVLVWFWCSFILFAGLQLQVVWLRFVVGGGFAG